MTYEEKYQVQGRIAHRNLNDTSDNGAVDQLRDAFKMALEEMSGYHDWWFLEVNCKLPLDAGIGSYDFPTTDAAGDAIELANIKVDSFRTAQRYGLEWIDATKIDASDPDWTDEGETGSPELVTISAGKIALWKTPSAGFVSANPYLYFRGTRMLREPGGEGDNDPAWTDSIQDIPRNWQRCLDPGILKWAYKQARSDRWATEEQLFYAGLRDMAAKCRPTRGLGRSNRLPSRIFRPGGGVSRIYRRDYGQ